MKKNEKELIAKWEEMGFLDDVAKNQKLPMSQTFDKILNFIRDLDENKRFNHADLQELMDLGVAMFSDILKDDITHQVDTDNLFRLFFNTEIKKLGLSPFQDDLGDLRVYQLIRYHIINDNGESINNKYNIDVEALLCDLLIGYYKNNFMINNDEVTNK